MEAIATLDIEPGSLSKAINKPTHATNRSTVLSAGRFRWSNACTRPGSNKGYTLQVITLRQKGNTFATSFM